jgi:hypothetical protein
VEWIGEVETAYKRNIENHQLQYGSALYIDAHLLRNYERLFGRHDKIQKLRERLEK